MGRCLQVVLQTPTAGEASDFSSQRCDAAPGLYTWVFYIFAIIVFSQAMESTDPLSNSNPSLKAVFLLVLAPSVLCRGFAELRDELPSLVNSAVVRKPAE